MCIRSTILSAIISFFIVGCAEQASAKKSTYVFDEWAEGDDGFSPVTFFKLKSPTGMFDAEQSTEDVDSSDKRLISIINNADGRKISIGRSARGFDMIWKQTQIGDILIVENQVDTHVTTSYVIYPQIDGRGDFTYSVLYATPDPELFVKEYGGPPEHIYSSVEDISYDGVMTIFIGWDFTSFGDGNCITTKIPLFYGFSKNSDNK